MSVPTGQVAGSTNVGGIRTAFVHVTLRYGKPVPGSGMQVAGSLNCVSLTGSVQIVLIHGDPAAGVVEHEPAGTKSV